MLGVGIIGCGQISELHCRAYEGRSDARIVAVSDKNRDAANLRARELGLSESVDVYTDYQDLLSRDDVDVVEILVPHHLHCEMTIAALAAGKHVSLQKPMTISLAEADQLVDLAATSSTQLRVIENFIFYPPIQRAKEIIDAGELGELTTIRLKSAAGYNEHAWPSPSEQWRYSADECGGGPMVFDDGHHKFAIAWHFLGMPSLVHSFIGSTVVGPGALLDCPALVSWSYEGGALGSFETTYSPGMFVETDQYPQDDRIEITGTKGILWVTRGHGKLLDAPAVIVRTGHKTVTHDDMETSWSSSFVQATDHFLRSLESGAQALLSPAQAREVLSFAFAAEESGRVGHAVTPSVRAQEPAATPSLSRVRKVR
jgi:predicted dehydrogenase